MDAKIQELTDKIYREGVEKGNEEAEKIIAVANAKKDRMIKEAKQEAARIVAEAKKQSEEQKNNTEAEIKLFASQAEDALKSEITNLVNGSIVSSSVKAATADTAFMQKMILEIAKEWAKNGAMTIQSSQAKELTAYFEANAKDLLNKGVKIESVNGKPASFSLVPADGSYKVTFGNDEFIAYFKDFLRPQLIEMLFQS